MGKDCQPLRINDTVVFRHFLSCHVQISKWEKWFWFMYFFSDEVRTKRKCPKTLIKLLWCGFILLSERTGEFGNPTGKQTAFNTQINHINTSAAIWNLGKFDAPNFYSQNKQNNVIFFPESLETLLSALSAMHRVTGAVYPEITVAHTVCMAPTVETASQGDWKEEGRGSKTTLRMRKGERASPGPWSLWIWNGGKDVKRVF